MYASRLTHGPVELAFTDRHGGVSGAPLATTLGAALSLPVVALLGFNPAKGRYDTTALIIVYIVLPVAIKIVAALLIWYIRIEAERGSVRDEMRGHKVI